MKKMLRFVLYAVLMGYSITCFGMRRAPQLDLRERFPERIPVMLAFLDSDEFRNVDLHRFGFDGIPSGQEDSYREVVKTSIRSYLNRDIDLQPKCIYSFYKCFAVCAFVKAARRILNLEEANRQLEEANRQLEEAKNQFKVSSERAREGLGRIANIVGIKGRAMVEEVVNEVKNMHDSNFQAISAFGTIMNYAPLLNDEEGARRMIELNRREEEEWEAAEAEMRAEEESGEEEEVEEEEEGEEEKE